VTGWDRAARLYDFQLLLERTAIDRALDLAAVKPGDRLLDLGTGTGALLARLAARATAPREAVGVDLSAPMPRRCRFQTRVSMSSRRRMSCICSSRRRGER
jgi:cyclopropane fatty-acyl-phospholipid synthase-like methyltransferase